MYQPLFVVQRPRWPLKVVGAGAQLRNKLRSILETEAARHHHQHVEQNNGRAKRFWSRSTTLQISMATRSLTGSDQRNLSNSSRCIAITFDLYALASHDASENFDVGANEPIFSRNFSLRCAIPRGAPR
jgi:hypothetical protein